MTIRLVLGLAFVALSVLYWVKVGAGGHDAFRRRCERHFRVIIDTDGRGYWDVRSKLRPLRAVAIECLQLVFFIALFFGWAVLLVATLLVGKLALS